MQIMHLSARAATPLAAPERRPVSTVVTTDDRTLEAIGQQFEKALVVGKPTVRPPSPTWLFSGSGSEPTASFASPSSVAGTGAGDTIFDLFARIVATNGA